MPRHLINLICGSTGAGKTNYAIELTQRLGAIRISIDEWMTALFLIDRQQPIDPAWAMERISRCQDQIWSTSLQAARQGIPCVLDLGFTQKSQRSKFVALASDAGLLLQLHFLDVPATERWRRVEQRNAAKSATYQLTFNVTREMFDYVEGMWEPPADEDNDRMKRFTHFILVPFPLQFHGRGFETRLAQPFNRSTNRARAAGIGW